MSSDFQAEFAGALFDPHAEVPPIAVDPSGAHDAKRFAVYRNNVISSLAEAIEEGFPIVAKIVGAEFARAMAIEFVRAHPPKNPLMIYYGEAYADFIAGFAPAATVPYLADIARVEYARRRAYYAADAEYLVANWWQSVAAEDIPHLKLGLHPSLWIIASDYPIYDIWRRNRDHATATIGATGQTVLVARRAGRIVTAAAPRGAADFFAALGEHQSIAAAAQIAFDADSEAAIQELVASALPLAIDFKRGEND